MASIRKRGDKWQARVRIHAFPAQEKSFGNRKDAEAWAKITEADMLRGTFIQRTDAERTTLCDALDRYAREITANKRGACVEAIRINSWKKTKLAKKSLASLRPADFAEYRDARLSAGLASSTVKRELAVIGNLFNIARREWGFDGLANPVEVIRLPSVDNARDRLFLDGEEAMLMAALDSREKHNPIGLLHDAAKNPWLAPLVRLALETAMRRSELLTLTWENIDLKAQVARLPLTKNGSSRDVPLSSAAVEVLRSLPRTLRGAVFPVTANAVKLAFIRAVARGRRWYEQQCKAEGIEPDNRLMSNLHFHDLRHIAVTRLAEKLPNLVELASVVTHHFSRNWSRKEKENVRIQSALQRAAICIENPRAGTELIKIACLNKLARKLGDHMLDRLN